MSVHTPGPWHLGIAENDSGRIKKLVPVDADRQSLLTVVEWNGVKFAAVYFDADAHLIAAAPDLLDALKSICIWMEGQARAQSKGAHPTFDLMMLREQRDIASAAIAKAERGAN